MAGLWRGKGRNVKKSGRLAGARLTRPQGPEGTKARPSRLDPGQEAVLAASGVVAVSLAECAKR